MKKHILNASIIIALATTATATFASEQEIYEKPTVIGFSSGAIAGAIIGGPVGAVIAGTIGLLIGNAEELDDQRQAAETVSTKTQSQLKTMTAEKQSLLSNLNKIENQNKQLTEQLNLANNTINSAETLEQLKLNLQFKVNSSEVEDFYQGQVKQLAQIIKQNPQMKIHLSGYADRNGDETDNLTLSEKRVAAVKSLLIEQGVTESNIETLAMGESSPMKTQQDYQSDFYDRRVEIKLQPQEVLTAGNEY